MGFTALLSVEIKLHGVGLAARMLRAYRRYHKFPCPKNLLAPNTFSCHWLQKRNSSLCFLLLHNLACKSMCLSLAQQLFTWFLQVSLVSWQRTALRTEWSLHPSHTACSHPSLQKPQQCRGAWQWLGDTPGGHGLWILLFLLACHEC